MAEIGTDAIGGNTLGLGFGGRGPVSAQALTVISDADLAPETSVSERGLGHCADEYYDKSDTRNNRPFTFGPCHDLCSHEEISHFAELLVALLDRFIGRKRG